MLHSTVQVNEHAEIITIFICQSHTSLSVWCSSVCPCWQELHLNLLNYISVVIMVILSTFSPPVVWKQRWTVISDFQALHNATCTCVHRQKKFLSFKLLTDQRESGTFLTGLSDQQVESCHPQQQKIKGFPDTHNNVTQGRSARPSEKQVLISLTSGQPPSPTTLARYTSNQHGLIMLTCKDKIEEWHVWHEHCCLKVTGGRVSVITLCPHNWYLCSFRRLGGAGSDM